MRNRTVGLDIGSGTLRGAEIQEDRHAAKLVRYAEHALPAGLMDHGSVTDPHALTQELRKFWKEAGFKTRRVALAIGGSQIVVRTAELSEADTTNDEALVGAITDLVPIPLAEAIVDTLQTDTFLDAEKRSMVRVLVVAVPRVLVDAIVESLLDARLTPARVDLAPIAAARAVATRHTSIDSRAAEVVIDVGATTTSVVVTADGLPRMVRILPVGTAAAIAEMEKELGCSREEAMRQTSEVGLVSQAPEYPIPGTSGVLERSFGAAIAEIAASVNYYRGTADAAVLTRALVVGGGARFGGLIERLEHDLEVPVQHGNAFSNLADAPDDEHAECFGAVAVGAGIDQ